MKIPLLLVVLHFVAVASYIAPPIDDEDEETANTRQCTGYGIDFSRLRSLSTADVNSLVGTNPLVAEHTYARSRVTNITEGSPADSNQATAPRCIGTRHRLQENIEDVPIHGADILVTTDNCLTNDTDDYNIASNYGGSFLNMLAGDDAGASIQRLTGKTFTIMQSVPNGYIPTTTPEAAVQMIAERLGVALDAVGDPALELFISTGGDFLSYRSYVIVESQGSADLVEIVVDAHDLSILSQCNLNEPSISTAERRQRSLRSTTSEQETSLASQSMDVGNDYHNHHRKLFSCESCATSVPVTWSRDTATCTLSSLYLDDTERTTICTVGTNQNDNSPVVGPGPVADLYWKGTLNCGGNDGTTCNAVILPDCRDALSDVQFGGIAALQFLRDHLGFQGGIDIDANSPVSVKAYAHYLNQYCNAFYNPSTNSVYFGDCNCHTWSPLASLDIVGHELFHGVTYHSSKLVYSGQSGGLNEGYSDIFGTVLEFSINDYNDPPDFTIAEQVGAILRNMEFPASRSIGTVCDYEPGLKVHYSSGALNKAFVKSVRSCVANGCSDLSGCTMLLGKHFLYSNIHGLTQTSDFLDGAEASCSLVEEFFIVRAPQATCTPNQVKQFIIEGWATVDVAIDRSSCQAVTTCPLPPSSPTPNPTRGPTAQPTRAPMSAPTETQGDGDGSPSNSGGGVESLPCLLRLRNALGRVFPWV